MSDSDDSLDPLLVEQTIEHIDAKINRLELSLSQKDISHDPLPKPIAAILTHLPHAHTTSSQQVTTTAFVFVPDLRLRQALADHITSTRAVTSLKNHIHLKHQRKLYHDWTRIKLQIPEPQPLPSLKKSLPRSDIVRTEQEWQTTLEMLSVDPVKRILDRVAQEPPLDLEYSPKYTNTNHLVQDPALDLKQYNDRIHLWSEAERAEFKKNLVLFDKSFAKISSFLPLKSTSDCVHYFYREKVNARFKQLLRRTPGRQKRKVDETSESLQVYLLSPDEQVEHLGPVWVETVSGLSTEEKEKAQRGFDLFGPDFNAVASIVCRPPEMIAEYYETLVKAGQISLRKGKKKRKQPLVPQSAPHDEDRKTISYWSVSERQLFLVAFKQHGKGNWDKISAEITTKSAIQVRNYYHNSRTKPEVVQVEREIEERDRQDTPANDEPDTAQPVYDLSARNIMYLGGQSPTSNHPQPMSISIPPPHELQERGSTSPRKLEMSYILASGVSKRDEREIQRGPVRSNSVSVPHSEYDLDEESKRWKSDVGATSHPASTWPQPGLSPSKAAPLPFPAQKNVEYTILGTEHQNLSPAQKSPAGSPIITKPLSKRVRGRGRGRGGKSRQSKGDPAASHPVLSMTEQQSHFQVQVMQIVQQPEFVTKSKKGDVEKNVELQVEIDAGILLQNASSSQAHKDIKVDHLTADAALNSPTSITPLQPKLETAVTRLAIPALLKTPVKQGTMGHIEKKGPVGAVDMGAPTIGDSPTRIAETPATLPIREAKLARSPICAVQPESSPTHDVNAMKSPIRDLQPVPIREPQPVSSPTRDMKRAPSPLRAQQPVSSPSRASPTRSPLSKPPSASLSPKHTSPISSSTVLIPTVASAAAYSAASNSVGFGFGSGIGVKRPMSTIRSPQKHQEAEVQLQGLTSSLSKPGSNSSQHASENVVHAQLETSVTEPAPTGDTRVVPSRSDIDH